MSFKEAHEKPLKTAAIREYGTDDLRDEVVRLRREQFNLRVRGATTNIDSPMQFRMMRRNIARIETVIREREEQ